MKIARKTRGFTLVEILIVVIILGILAAIVIPQFTNASTDARKASVRSIAQTLRSQVELYKLQHGDKYPTDTNLVGGAWVWEKLTGKTNYDGSTSGGSLQYGPYMQSTPKNGLITDANKTSFVGSTLTGGNGFAIDTNGKITANDGADAALGD
jgi:general secretion pathway protein G